VGRIGSGVLVSVSFQKKSRRVLSYGSKRESYDPGFFFAGVYLIATYSFCDVGFDVIRLGVTPSTWMPWPISARSLACRLLDALAPSRTRSVHRLIVTYVLSGTPPLFPYGTSTSSSTPQLFTQNSTTVIHSTSATIFILPKGRYTRRAKNHLNWQL